jgi:tetratricopeptide (TPR) repeat protein
MAWSAARGGPLWDEAFWQPPFYPFALGLLYRIVAHDMLWPRLVQCLLGALSCILLYAIGRRVFGHWTGSVAAIAMALYGPLIYYDGELLPATLNVFLVLAGLLLLLRAADVSQIWTWLAPGLAFGLAAITRPDVLAFLALVPLWALFRRRWSLRGAGLRAATLVLGVALPIAIVTARNFGVSGDFVLISSNGGLNFYLGNNAHAAETVSIRPGFAWDALVNEPYLKAGIVKPSERSRYFFAKGMAFIRENPAAALRLYGKKLALYWSGHEIGRNRDPYVARESSRVLRASLWRQGGFGFPFGVVAPLALGGLVLGFSREPRRVLLVLFVLAYVVTGVLFFVAARYRLTAVPILLLFAAAFGHRMVDLIHARRKVQAMVAGAAVVLGFLFVNRETGAEQVFRGEIDRYLGVHYTDLGREDLAEAAYRRAIAADSNYAEAHAELGQLLIQDGRAEEALLHCHRAQALCPQSEKTAYLVGKASLARGDTAGAVSWLKSTIALAPYAPAHRDLGIIAMESGRLAEAEAMLSHAGRLDPEDVDIWYKLGQCRFLQGNYGEAKVALREALRLLPGDQEIMAKIASLEALERARIQGVP